MRRLLFILTAFIFGNILNAKDVFTLASGEWSYDGITACNCKPANGDNVVINHDITITEIVNWDNMTITINEGATLLFLDEVVLGPSINIVIKANGVLDFKSNVDSYSENFINYGAVYYDGFINNFGKIISFGIFKAHSEGRKVYNEGQFNDLIGGTGPQGDQAYKDSELNQSDPTAINLPIIWGDVDGTKVPDGYMINWEVLSELNNRNFYILGKTWDNRIDTLSFVASYGNHNELIRYEKFLLSSENYLYLGVGQYDWDGKSSFGFWVAIEEVYSPNWTWRWGDYQLTMSSTSEINFDVYSSSGQLVLSRKHFTGEEKLILSGMDWFVLSVWEGNNNKVLKIKR